MEQAQQPDDNEMVHGEAVVLQIEAPESTDSEEIDDLLASAHDADDQDEGAVLTNRARIEQGLFIKEPVSRAVFSKAKLAGSEVIFDQ